MRPAAAALVLALLVAAQGARLGADPVHAPAEPGPASSAGRPAAAPAGECEPLAGQVADLEAEVAAMRRELAVIQRQLARMETLLSRRGAGGGDGGDEEAALPAAIDVGTNPFKGQPGAPLVLVEYSDYECPFCARNARETLPRLEEEYVAPGRLRYVFADYPLSSHRHAVAAAVAANCAGEQGAYWPMHDLLFANHREIEPERLPAYADSLGLDLERFRACLDDDEQRAEVERDQTEASRAGVRATPTFFVGIGKPGSSQIRVLEKLRGAVGFPRLKQILDRHLADLGDGAD